jgi:hypothetical protein
MATDKPKVSGYVPAVLKERLKEFCAENGDISESQALTIVLAEYFGVELEVKPAEVVIGGVTLEAFRDMQASFSALLERVAVLEAEVTALPTPVAGEPPSPTPVVSPRNVLQSCSGRGLAKRLKCHSSTITFNWRQGKAHFLAWSAENDPDSVRWWRDDPSDLFEPVDHPGSTPDVLSLPIPLSHDNCNGKSDTV